MPGLIIERPLHINHNGYRKVIQEEPAPASPPLLGRVPRVARLLAMAHRFDEALKQGQVSDQVELAQLGRVTTARVSQIMSLLYLAPDLQDAILHLPPTTIGRDPIILQQLLPIAATPDWKVQRQLWKRLRANTNESQESFI